MTLQYINVTVGTALANGDIPVHGRGAGAAQVGHVSVVYDDATITKQNQLLAALRQAIAQSPLPKG